MKRLLLSVFLLFLLAIPASATIKWVDFDVPYEALQRALSLDIQSQNEDFPLSWIDLLAVTATQNGGVTASQVSTAYRALSTGKSPRELLGEAGMRTYRYYREAYGAVLSGIVGNYAVKIDGVWKTAYGVKAFSPIAAGYYYADSDDFGVARNYGFRRQHLGHDMMGSLGTPIVAVESGTVEALGWNQYGGWRIGIRTDDSLRYYYYAHLRKDNPYVEGLKEGDRVEAGQVIGFMGRTGYSAKENTNNIETVHLHFGLQLVFDESQKECNSEIWVDVYALTRLLSQHRSSVLWNDETGKWERIYEFCDLDRETLPSS